MTKRTVFWLLIRCVAASMAIGFLAGCDNFMDGINASDNADLASLVIDHGTLRPGFHPSVLSYNAVVPYAVEAVKATALPAQNGATVNNPAAAGKALEVGENTLTITVTAEDGKTTKIYTVTVARQEEGSQFSNDAALKALALSAGALSPPFDPEILSYTASVLYAAETVTASAEAAHSKATLENSAAEGQALAVGNNTITIAVTAEDRVTAKTYTVTVTRQEETYQPSNDAALKALALSAGTLSPAFSPVTTEYAASVASDVDGVTVTAEPSHPHATAAGLKAPLVPGPNTVVVTVTAEDGKTTKTYTITVARAFDARLASLAIDHGALEPVFDPDTLSYAASVLNAVDAITVAAAAAQSGAAVNNPAAAGKALEVGNNTITIAVTAADKKTTKTYVITVVRQEEAYQPSADAALKALSLSAGALSPAFAPGITEYAAAVESGVGSVIVAAAQAHPKAKVSNPAGSGFSLVPGSNTIAITVTAEDETTVKTYAVTIVRAFDARLASLAIAPGILEPVFSPDTLSYAAGVLYAVDAITVTAAAAQSGAAVSNPAAAGKALEVGGNTITITVTAADKKTTKTYVITVVRQEEEYRPSNDAALKALALSAGTLSPAFAPGTTEYAAAVGSGVGSVIVTAEPSHPKAKVAAPANPGVSLVPGSNTVAVTVAAEDGKTTKTYTITVARPFDAGLRSLAIDRGTLTPAFNPETPAYAASVLYAVDAITVAAAAAQSGAAVSNPAAAGKALEVGENTITITVTAADKKTTKTYAITVTRQAEAYQPSNDAALKALALSAGTLSPAFSPGTTAYAAAVGPNVSSVSVTAAPSHQNAAVSNPAAAGQALAVGENTITIAVTAEDGKTTKTYAVTVVRAFDASFESLAIDHGALTPAFSPGVLSYAASVPYTVEAVTVTAAAAQSGATAAATGGKPLVVGGNTITVVVTAADGKTTKAYTITVARQAEPLSNDAALKTLTLSAGTLSPAFAPGTTAYSVAVENSVSSITVAVGTNHANAAVSNPAAAGQALVVGGNTITITVTAPDGVATKTYTVTVTRAQPAIPAAPVIRVKEGSTKLTVEWDPAPGATAYEVWYFPSYPGADQTPQRSGEDISGTGHVITGLSIYLTPAGFPRDDYKVLVYAKNDTGRSATAGEWTGDLLEAGRLLVQGSNSNGTVQFDTNMVGDYRVIYVNDKDDLNTAREATTTPAPDADNVIVTGLTNGVTWYFWIQARTNAGGESDWSDSVSYTPHIPTPVISQLIPANESIEVYWGPVTSADSLPVSYEVWYYESASGAASETKAEDGLPSGPYIITGLANDTAYTVYVKATTQHDAVDSLTKTATPHPPPATPAAPTLTPGIGQLGVSWTASGDSSVTACGVWYHTADNPSLAVKYAEVPVSSTNVTIKGLDHNTTYYVWLKAKNVVFSPFSPSANAATLASGIITVGFDDGLITITDGSSDVSGGFALPASGSVTLSATGGSFDAVNWYVDGSLVAGNTITLNGASYNDRRDHSVTFTGTKGGILYSSNPIPFRVTP